MFTVAPTANWAGGAGPRRGARRHAPERGDGEATGETGRLNTGRTSTRERTETTTTKKAVYKSHSLELYRVFKH